MYWRTLQQDIRLAMLCMSSMLAAEDSLTSDSVCVSPGLAKLLRSQLQVQFYTQLSQGIEYSLLNCYSRVDRTTRAPVVNYASSAALHGRLSLIVIFIVAASVSCVDASAAQITH